MATKKQQNKIEYTYRYDRIFLLIVTILIIFLGLYWIFSGDEDKNEALSPSSSLPTQKAEVTIKEKHLSVSETTLQKAHTPLVYLFYEEINVLDTFYFPLKKENSEQKNSGLKKHKEHTIKELPTEKIDERTEQPLSKEKQNSKAIKTANEKKATSEALDEIEKEIITTIPIQYAPAHPSLPKENDTFIQINSKNLSRVSLVSNIYKKEPVNELSRIVSGKADSAKKIYLFTQINNNVGQTIEHQWWYQGNKVHTRKFTILGKRWRCYSSKNIGKFQQGEWLVKVIDEKDNILSTVNFQFQIN